MQNKTKIMGILNVTPDSFYDKYYSIDKAVERGILIQNEGADYIDIGGESTRPGSMPVNVQEEIRRVIPVIKELKKKISIPISIDSYKFEVIEKAVEAGADFINDIKGLEDKRIRELTAKKELESCIMHMKGTPQTMQKNPVYKNVVEEVYEFLKERKELAIEEGVLLHKIYVDPGIGFGKTTEQNSELINNIKKFKKLGKVLIGVSRKSFIAKLFGPQDNPLPVEERLQGSLEIAKLCIKQGVDMLRVHDVEQTREIIQSKG